MTQWQFVERLELWREARFDEKDDDFDFDAFLQQQQQQPDSAGGEGSEGAGGTVKAGGERPGAIGIGRINYAEETRMLREKRGGGGGGGGANIFWGVDEVEAGVVEEVDVGGGGRMQEAASPSGVTASMSPGIVTPMAAPSNLPQETAKVARSAPKDLQAATATVSPAGSGVAYSMLPSRSEDTLGTPSLGRAKTKPNVGVVEMFQSPVQYSRRSRVSSLSS